MSSKVEQKSSASAAIKSTLVVPFETLVSFMADSFRARRVTLRFGAGYAGPGARDAGLQ
jgi:hypothetical protein